MKCDKNLKPMIFTGCRRLPDCEKANSFLQNVSNPLHIEDFHIGFWYEEYQMDNERYLNKGMIWVKKQYGFNNNHEH